MEAVETSLDEIVKLAAVDNDFYGRHFFPKAIRQKSPLFHKKVDEILEHPGNRHVAIKIFRGGAKTTKLRVFTSKRIAYGISHTILFVSEAQDHAIKSIEWLKRNVEFNKVWADTFQLRPGKKWSGSEIEILHGVDEYPIRIIALGITGQTRGVNIDDFRPDLIVVDDPCDEENTATPEQRKKISDLFFGALEKSLAPASECEDAMMVLLQTPLNSDDLIERCMLDKQWKTAQFSCFNADGTSAWSERWSTDTLTSDKQAHIDRNQLSLWLREMEVTVVADEMATFRSEWLEYWDILPEGMVTYLGVDPTPPPKENDATINPKLDDAVIMAVGFHKGKTYVLDYYGTKSPNPDDFISKLFEFVIRYRPMKVGFESLLFARTMKYYIEKEMRTRGHYFTITPVEDRRKKQIRIVQAISNRASNRTLVVNRSQQELITQYTAYPNVNHDDYLDALAIAIDLAIPGLADDSFIEGEFQRLADEEARIPELEEWRSAI
jgi:predicted phage terminase large subunit-like protein